MLKSILNEFDSEVVLLRKSELMKIFRMNSATTFRKFERSGIIKSIKIGGIKVWRKSDVLKYLEDLQNAS